MTGSMGLVSSAMFVALSGCILPQLEDPNSDVKFSENQGSLFGTNRFFFVIIHLI